MKVTKSLVVVGAAISFAAVACGPDMQFDGDFAESSVAPPAPPAVDDTLILPEVAQPPGGYVIAEFEGYADPVAGTFEIRMVDEQLVLPSAEASGLRTVEQGLFCNLAVDRNGVVGTGVANSVEIITELSDFGDGPALFGLHLGCAEVPGSPAPEENVYGEGILGAYCANVTVRSFYAATVLDEVHAELYRVSPVSGHSGYAHPLGTGAQPYGGLSNEFGLWYYGDIGPANGQIGGCVLDGEGNEVTGTGVACDEKTRRWVFQNSDSSPFNFNGRIRAAFQEICQSDDGTGLDDDCDGRRDEGANCYRDGIPCLSGDDCITEVCIGGTCGIPVTPSFVLQDVVTIGGGGTTANSFNRLELRIGAPAPMGTAQGASNTLILGPLSDR